MPFFLIEHDWFKVILEKTPEIYQVGRQVETENGRFVTDFPNLEELYD